MSQKLQEKARELAANFHEGQVYGRHPYTKHLQDVANVLKRFGLCEEWLLASAWLHDALEDTELPLERIQKEFGTEVAALVFAVTAEPGVNRKERNTRTYPKIKLQNMGVQLKLADRIANIEAAIAESPEKLKMYRKEYPAFREALQTKGVADEMWQHLESLFSR